MAFDFEEFTGRWRQQATGPKASIQRRGTMSLNKAAFEALGKPSHVLLLYDRTARVIGVKPADSSIKHAYPLRKQPAADSYLFSGVTFLDYYHIPHDKLTAFDDVEAEDGVLILRLDRARTGEPVQRNRRQLPMP